MGLDLHHFKVIDPDIPVTHEVEVFNTMDFPDDFKERFSDKIVPSVVHGMIDWEKTIREVFKMEPDDFYDRYEPFLTTHTASGQEKYHFCLKSSKNPIADPASISILSSKCRHANIPSNEVHAVFLGYQRSGMRDEFLKIWKSDRIIIDLDEVKKMAKFCINTEYSENFVDNFIANWTDNSFVQIII